MKAKIINIIFFFIIVTIIIFHFAIIKVETGNKKRILKSDDNVSISENHNTQQTELLLSGNNSQKNIVRHPGKSDIFREHENELVGKKFELRFNDILSGEKIDVNNYNGYIIVINFWATWCVPCVDEMPDIIKTFLKYKDKKVIFIGVSLDDNINKAKNYCERKGIKWYQYCDRKGWNCGLVDKWKIDGIPTLFILDKNGKLYTTEARDNLDEILQKMI